MFIDRPLCARCCTEHFTPHFILTISVGSMCYYCPYHKDEKTEVQRGYLARHTARKPWSQDLHPGG